MPYTMPHSQFIVTHLPTNFTTYLHAFFLNFVYFLYIFQQFFYQQRVQIPLSTRSFQNGGIRIRQFLVLVQQWRDATQCRDATHLPRINNQII